MQLPSSDCALQNLPSNQLHVMSFWAASSFYQVKTHIGTRIEVIQVARMTHRAGVEVNFRAVQKNNVTVALECIVPLDSTCPHSWPPFGLIRLLLF